MNETKKEKKVDLLTIANAPDLTEEDEKILDEVWDTIGKREQAKEEEQ